MAIQCTIKFNGGRGAVLCPECDNIIHYGFEAIHSKVVEHLKMHDNWPEYKSEENKEQVRGYNSEGLEEEQKD
jgi:transcription elongation factor Elf1